MIAGYSVRGTGWLFLVMVLILVLTGCGKTEEADSRPIRILGTPTSQAYVGVEYLYEVGVDGGDGELRYTLTNAPDWLEIDIIDNALRRGVLLRGIPGATGRDEDLTDATNVILTVTDGNSLETVEFGIDVSQVEFAEVSGEVAEGERGEYPEDTYDSNENGVIDSRDETRPGTICMDDDSGNPLFTDEEVDFFVDNQLDPDAWGGDRVRLEFLPINLNTSFYLDVLGTYTLEGASAELGFDLLERVTTPGGNVVAVDSGRFHIPAGETTCYVMLFIVDDLIAESDETFSVDLSIDTVGDLAASVTSLQRLTIEDNEPIVSFSVPKVSVSESQGRNIRIPVTVTLDREPEQTVFAEFQTVNVQGVERADLTGSPPDLIITPGSFRVEFAKGITEARILLEAPANNDGVDTDEQLTLGWVDTDTVRASDSELTIYINEWLDDLRTPLPDDAQIIESLTDTKANLYVGYSYLSGDGYRSIRVQHFARERENLADELINSSLLREIELEQNGVNYELNDIAVTRYDASSGDEIVELYVLATVDKVAVPPPDGAGFSLGGTDILLQKYENVNGVGTFERVWQRQIGTPFNDFASSMSLDRVRAISVVGGTEGSFFDSSSGGTDNNGYFLKVSDEGEVTSTVEFGSGAEEYLVEVAQDGPTNVSAFGIVERGSEGGTAIQMRSLSGEGETRRSAEFGSSRDEIIYAVNSGPKGAILAAATEGAIGRLDTNQGGWDAVLTYHQNLSEITSVKQWGTPEDDRILDAKQVDSQVYGGGYTTGDLFEPNQGGEDGWIARYDIVENEEIEQEVFEQVWEFQKGSAGDERVVAMVPTDVGKVFAISQEIDGGVTYLKVEALSIVDGISMYASCRESDDGC